MKEKLYTPYKPDLDFSGIDHIIVGSGLGGLSAAIFLAKGGKKVAVFERHYVPGGFTHNFKRRQGFQWDTGVHYVGNVQKDGALAKLFGFLTNQQLEWESMGEIYDVADIGGEEYVFRAGKENFRKQMKLYFPEEEEAIDKYLSLVDRASKFGSAFFFEKTFKPVLRYTVGWVIRQIYNRFSRKTTLEVLKSITNNQRLIAVLCAQCGNYGLTPKHSSFAVHALVINHFMEGGYYPKGGADQIAMKMIENLNAHGGQVYINADVSEIVTEKNKVKGIKIGDKFIACRNVISNVGANNTFNSLLNAADRKRCHYDLEKVEPSTAHLCLYVGLDKSDTELNLPKHNVWSFEHDDIDLVMDEITLENAAEKFSYISFPSAKDPLWREKNPGTATIQALTLGKYEWFKQFEHLPWKKRGEAYEQLKQNFEASMLNRLYELFPQIKGHVVEVEVSTPLSTKHFTNYQKGEIYGLAHTPQRFTLPFLRVETKIKGLRLTGQDITLVGVSGATLSGMLCAIPILKWSFQKVFNG